MSDNTANSYNDNKVVLHYGALPATGELHVNHIHQILGLGNHSTETIDRTLRELRSLKKDVKEWAGEQVKSKMAEVARSMGNHDNSNRMLLNGQEIRSFSNLKEWWADPDNQKEDSNKNSLYYCIYGYFEENKRWDDELEALYMSKFHLTYNEDSKRTMQEQCKRKGYKVKGCIASNIAMVKQELVKQIQKAGRGEENGVTLTKKRPRKAEQGDDNKRRQKGVFYIKPMNVENSPQQLRMEEGKKV